VCGSTPNQNRHQPSAGGLLEISSKPNSSVLAPGYFGTPPKARDELGENSGNFAFYTKSGHYFASYTKSGQLFTESGELFIEAGRVRSNLFDVSPPLRGRPQPTGPNGLLLTSSSLSYHPSDTTYWLGLLKCVSSYKPTFYCRRTFSSRPYVLVRFQFSSLHLHRSSYIQFMSIRTSTLSVCVHTY
jgi:hypothetical protein